MKSLHLSPSQHAFVLYVNDLNRGYADIGGRLLDEHDSAAVSEEEALKIGNWFIKLSKAIADKNKE